MHNESNSQGIASFVRFDSSASVDVSAQTLQNARNSIDGLPYSGGGTNFSIAAEKAVQCIQNARQDYPYHSPVMIFLSDGEASCPSADVLKQLPSGRSAHFIGFGNDSFPTLQEMSSMINGNFSQELDASALSRRFVEIAQSHSQKGRSN